MTNESRPAGAASEIPAKKSDTSLDHPAIAAVNAAMQIWPYLWEQGIRESAKHMAKFSAGDVQRRHALPSIGNATGGIFMRLGREQIIRRVGYRPSTAKSRSCGVAAVWSAGDAL